MKINIHMTAIANSPKRAALEKVAKPEITKAKRAVTSAIKTATLDVSELAVRMAEPTAWRQSLKSKSTAFGFKVAGYYNGNPFEITVHPKGTKGDVFEETLPLEYMDKRGNPVYMPDKENVGALTEVVLRSVLAYVKKVDKQRKKLGFPD